MPLRLVYFLQIYCDAQSSLYIENDFSALIIDLCIMALPIRISMLDDQIAINYGRSIPDDFFPAHLSA